MKFLSYNILKGGRDGDDQTRLGRVITLLQREQPDVLALQECNGFELHRARVLHALEDALDMRGQLATADSGYHVALLLRDAAFERVEVLRKGFAHAAIVARVVIDGLDLSVVGAHLSPFSSEQRLHEVEQILTRLEPVTRDGTPALVLGDLNAISPRDAPTTDTRAWPARYRARHLGPDGALDTRALAKLEDAGLTDLHALCSQRTGRKPGPTRPTLGFVGDRPAQRLDYIFASAALAVTVRDCRPCDDTLTRDSSDHRPLWAELA